MAAKPSKEEIKRQLEADHPEWSAPRPMPVPIKNVLSNMLAPEVEPIEDYSKAPWWIMRVQPNMYRTAAESLVREGFEGYTPTYRILTQLPLRKIPPKKRGNAGLYKQEVRRRRFEGYMFIRRLFGCYDVNRLFDLDGCGSIVTNASTAALVYDFEVELMRRAEEAGAYDQCTGEYSKGYKVARLPADGSDRWTGQTKIVGRLDDSGKTVLFVQRLGRVARLIADADPVGVTLGAKL